MIVRAISLYYQKDIILACCFVDLAPGHEEAIAKVVEGNVLKGRS
jgi:hypothetical protein